MLTTRFGHISRFNKEEKLKVVSENADGLRVSGLQILRLEAADPLAVAMPRIPSHNDGLERAEGTNPLNLEHMDMGDAVEEVTDAGTSAAPAVPEPQTKKAKKVSKK